jgi:hypothetical protein
MCDANLKMVREMNGKIDPEDIALADGNAYFARWKPFKSYLQ